MQSYSYESREILMAYVQDNFKIFYNTLKKSNFCHNVVTITVFFFFFLLPLGRGLEKDHWRVLGSEVQNFTMQMRDREQYVVMQKQRYFPLSRSLELLRYKHISKQGSNIFITFIMWLRVSGGF